MGVAINQYNRFISGPRSSGTSVVLTGKQTNKMASRVLPRNDCKWRWRGPRFDPSPVIHGSYYFLWIFINCANK